MRKQITSTLLALAGFLSANAQYTFTLNVSWSGNCSGYTAQMNQAIRGFQTQTINGFPTRELCEQTRAMCHQELAHIELIYYDVKTGKEIKREATNCKLNVSTTPCTGRPMAGTVGTLNTLGVSQGTSFYSANTANEIQNWSEDEARRRMGLDNTLQLSPPSSFDYIMTGDASFNRALAIDTSKPFRSLNVGEDGLINTHSSDVQFGTMIPDLNKREFEDELHQDFLLEYGIDILSILMKQDKTEEDKALLAKYQEWKEEKGRDLLIYKDMAIGAEVVYADSKLKNLLNSDVTSYRFIEKDDWKNNESINRLLQIIDLCNNASYNQGFHAEVLRNGDTNEYMVTFRGTEFPSKIDLLKELPNTAALVGSLLVPVPGATTTTAGGAMMELTQLINNITEGRTDRLPQEFHDLSTDATQAIGKVLTQYKMAIEVGQVICQIVEENPDVKINITGHSMGGGEGIIAGVVSGQPTYVFNPAGVSDATFDFAGVSDKVASGNFNIHKFTTHDDQLTNFQESNGTGWAIANKAAKTVAAVKGADPNKSIPKAIGKEHHLVTNEGHSMKPMAELLIKKHHIMNRVLSQGEEKTVNIYLE